MAYRFTEILIIDWHTEISKRLCEKDQANNIKDSGEAQTSTSLLTDDLTSK